MTPPPSSRMSISAGPCHSGIVLAVPLMVAPGPPCRYSPSPSSFTNVKPEVDRMFWLRLVGYFRSTPLPWNTTRQPWELSPHLSSAHDCDKHPLPLCGRTSAGCGQRCRPVCRGVNVRCHRRLRHLRAAPELTG